MLNDEKQRDRGTVKKGTLFLALGQTQLKMCTFNPDRTAWISESFQSPGPKYSVETAEKILSKTARCRKHEENH
jgi:hypothetical protein